MIRPVIRVLPALIALALSVLVAPQALAFSSVTGTGRVGHWKVTDNAVIGQEGARCFFVDNGSGGNDLRRVRVRPPSVVNGSHARLTWVGWRFKILRSTDNGATYKVIYRSRIWRDRASTTSAADGFTAKSWWAPAGLPSARILVQLTIFFFRPGSTTQIEGKVVGRYDNYVEKFQTFTGNPGSLCVTLEA